MRLSLSPSWSDTTGPVSILGRSARRPGSPSADPGMDCFLGTLLVVVSVLDDRVVTPVKRAVSAAWKSVKKLGRRLARRVRAFVEPAIARFRSKPRSDAYV